MNRIILLLASVVLGVAFPAYAAKIELEFKGQKQFVEFDPNNRKDLDRAKRLWMKADHKTFYVYSETGGFHVCEEPRNDSKCKVYGGWYQELSTSNVTSPHFASVVWDKTKWHPRGYLPGYGWLKLDDPNLIWPNQLKPVKEWPIRYMAYYGGIETNALEDGKKRRYDEYERKYYDRDGFLLDNQTMQRKKSPGGKYFLRMFQYKNLVHLEAVFANDLEKSVDVEGTGDFSDLFNLQKLMALPKVHYRDAGLVTGREYPVTDRGGGDIYVWATFDDPVKPVYDKFNKEICVIDCKSRKRWAP